jgi:hypothetical protein
MSRAQFYGESAGGMLKIAVADNKDGIRVYFLRHNIACQDTYGMVPRKYLR